MKKFKGNGYIEFGDVLTRTLFLLNIDEEHRNVFFLNGKSFGKEYPILVFKDIILEEYNNDLFCFFYSGTFVYLKKYSVTVIRDQYDNVLWLNEDYKKNSSLLCDQKFIGEYYVIANPKDGLYLDVLPRKCEYCFNKPVGNKKNCNVFVGKGNKRPRNLFRRRPNEKMTSVIDGKRVAQYCKHFAHPDLD